MDIINEPLFKITLSIVFALTLLKTPVIGTYISVINTLFHEVGHAVVSILTFGKVEKIELFSNTEGAAWSSSRFFIGRLLTSLAGYPAASATALLFLFLISKNNFLYIFIIISFVLLFSLIFWIRNIYGLFWSTSSLALLYGLIVYGNPLFIEIVLMIITSILLVQSILSSWDILNLSFKTPTEAGDATSLWKSTLIIPPQVWGILFFVQSLFFTGLGIKLFIS